MQPRRPRRVVHPEAPPRERARGRAAPASAQVEPGLVRLSKRMAAMGLCSRREADEWIERVLIGHVERHLATIEAAVALA